MDFILFNFPARDGVRYRELKISSSNYCNLYREQTTAGDGELDAGTESNSSMVDVYPPSERRRTESCWEDAGGEGLATEGHGSVDGEAA